MGRVRCSICNQSTSDETGSCDLCGADLPGATADPREAEMRGRAQRDLSEQRAKEARKPKGPANPDAETMFAVKQLTGFTNVLIDWNTNTRWEMTGGSGHVCYHAGEVLATKLDRAQRASNRPWVIEVRAIDGSPYGTLVFTLKREWKMLAPVRVDVFDGEGEAIGSVRGRFFSLGKSWDLFDSGENKVGHVGGVFLSPGDFEIRVGETRGKISKEWGGLLKELFSSADVFGVQLDESWDRPVRGLVFAALFLIDFLYYENNSGARAGWDIATD